MACAPGLIARIFVAGGVATNCRRSKKKTARGLINPAFKVSALPGRHGSGKKAHVWRQCEPSSQRRGQRYPTPDIPLAKSGSDTYFDVGVCLTDGLGETDSHANTMDKTNSEKVRSNRLLQAAFTTGRCSQMSAGCVGPHDVAAQRCGSPCLPLCAAITTMRPVLTPAYARPCERLF